MEVGKEIIEELQNSLLDQDKPIALRFRSLFTLTGLGNDKKEIIDALVTALSDPSALLRHEVAYCLGQMGDSASCPILSSILKDFTEHPMVRHEAAEALGAIATPESLLLLKDFANDPVREVAETCQLALSRIEWYAENRSLDNSSEDKAKIYFSVDPAPPLPPAPVDELKKKYLSGGLPIFERYRALFALRDLGGTASVEALAEGLNDESALLKHEVAFVLGQLQHASAVPGLTQLLSKTNEAAMVRHEAAEALGAIAYPGSLELLQKYANDKYEDRIVRESCEVALDVHQYFNNDEEFQYADGLKIYLEKAADKIKPAS